MLVFGIVGVALAGIIALALVGAAFAARDLDERVADQQARVAASLDKLATTTGAMVGSLENAGGTLDSSSIAVLHARDVLDELAAASNALASGLDISILGSQPFAGAATRFRTFSERVLVFREDASTIAERLSTNGDDMAALAVRMAAMERELADYAERIETNTQLGQIGSWIAASVVLGSLLALWLAVAAGACAWVGWRLRKD